MQIPPLKRTDLCCSGGSEVAPAHSVAGEDSAPLLKALPGFAVGFAAAACMVPTLLTKSYHFHVKISMAAEQDCSRSLYFPSL